MSKSARSFWVKNTRGKPDAMLTFSFIAFFVVIVKFIFAGIDASLFGFSIQIGQIDSSIVAALLTPTFGAYVARRYSDRDDGSLDAIADSTIQKREE